MTQWQLRGIVSGFGDEVNRMNGSVIGDNDYGLPFSGAWTFGVNIRWSTIKLRVSILRFDLKFDNTSSRFVETVLTIVRGFKFGISGKYSSSNELSGFHVFHVLKSLNFDVDFISTNR